MTEHLQADDQVLISSFSVKISDKEFLTETRKRSGEQGILCRETINLKNIAEKLDSKTQVLLKIYTDIGIVPVEQLSVIDDNLRGYKGKLKSWYEFTQQVFTHKNGERFNQELTINSSPWGFISSLIISLAVTGDIYQEVTPSDIFKLDEKMLQELSDFLNQVRKNIVTYAFNPENRSIIVDYVKKLNTVVGNEAGQFLDLENIEEKRMEYYLNLINKLPENFWFTKVIDEITNPNLVDNPVSRLCMLIIILKEIHSGIDFITGKDNSYQTSIVESYRYVPRTRFAKFFMSVHDYLVAKFKYTPFDYPSPVNFTNSRGYQTTFVPIKTKNGRYILISGRQAKCPVFLGQKPVANRMAIREP